MAADYRAFARALGEHFAVHTIERRGRGESGPQGSDYSILKECEDVLAVRTATAASLLVGHSYGGLIALEVARGSAAFTKLALYEPGVSIDGAMPTSWMPGYQRKLAEGKRVDAFVEFTRADGPPRIQRMPSLVLKLIVVLLVRLSGQYRQMLCLLEQNLREWIEIARLNNTYTNYAEITADVLLMYGGRSDSVAVDLVASRLPAVIPHARVMEFPRLDHFGIERTAPREVAMAIGEFFRKSDPSPRPRAPGLAL